MIESGAVKDQQTWLIEPKPEVAREVADGGMRVAQERLVELSVARREAGDNFRAVLESQERATAEAAKERALREVVERERDELARREAVLINRVTAAEERAFGAERGMSAELEDARREIEALRERAAHAVDAAAVARGEVEHERMRAASAGERAEATALLSRQQQTEIQALREEIRRLRERVGMVSSQRDELIASRWRQYGQKLGLVMTMPWERELRNGTH
jgi:chromosome segregation ATPase